MKGNKAARSSEAKKWLAKLGSRSDAKGAEAESALLNLGEVGLEAVLEHASQYQKRHLMRVCIPFNLCQAILGVGGANLICFGLGRLLHLSDTLMIVMMLPAVVIGVLLNAVYLGPGLLYPRSERRFIKMLAGTDDVRVLPHLLSAFHGQFLSGNLGIEAGLTRLLAKVREDGEITLTASQRVSLNCLAAGKLLRTRFPDDLILSALYALPILGNFGSIKAVKSLLESNAAPRNPDVMAAGKQCLEALEGKFGRTQGKETLLRAAGPTPGLPTEDLLRPTADE